MREEYELEVLEQYDLEVKNVRRVRGAFLCETEEGLFLLKEAKISAQRAPLYYEALRGIKEKGRTKVDLPVRSKEGELITTAPTGTSYMLKQWYGGRECDIRQEQEAVRAAQTLAWLHRDMENNEVPLYAGGCPAAGNPAERLKSHNQELKKVRTFIRRRPVKNEFEFLFLSSFEKMYEIAEITEKKMEQSDCGLLYEESVERRHLLHGDYNYHNLLQTREGLAVTNFEHMHIGICVEDLYYFLRKAMEKNQWKLKSGQKILNAYEEIRPLTKTEREFVGLNLAYPEKFWKTAGGYYRSNKAHLPEKSVEKLETAVRQSKERYELVNSIFPLNL